MNKERLTRDYKQCKLKYGEKPAKEDLLYLYMEENMAVTELTEYFGTSKTTIQRWLAFYSIKRKTNKVDRSFSISKDMLDNLDKSRLSRDYQRYPYQPRKEAPNKEDFEYLYLELNWSREDIAEYIGVGKNTVSRILNVILKLNKSNKQKQLARESANYRKYGVKYPITTEEVRDKAEATCIKKYGVKSALYNTSLKEQGMLVKYGVKYALQSSDILNKMKEKNLDKYGVEYTFQTDEVRERIKDTLKSKYGVDNISKLPLTVDKIRNSVKEHFGDKYSTASQVPEVKEKTIKTNLGKYGVKYPMQNKEVQEKCKETMVQKYGVATVFTQDGFKEYTHDVMLERYGTTNTNILHVNHRENLNREYWLKNFIDPRGGGFDTSKCAIYHGISNSCVQTYLDKFNISIRHKGGSINESDIIKYIYSLGVKNVEKSNRKIIAPKELDIYIPDYNLAIEYDGLMYHSQGRLSYGKLSNVHPRYHLKKTEQCLDKGIQLLHIFENEWLDNEGKRDIWKSVLCSKLGYSERVYARKLKVKKLDFKEVSCFCEANHLQGYTPSLVSYALVDGDVIYAVMTFGKSRFNKGYDWELLRYCCRKYFTIVGGASRLLSHFREDYPGSIISYANRRWSNGGLYKKLGFTYKGVTNPNYFYFKTTDGIKPVDMILYSRLGFQKHKLKDKLDKYNGDFSEKENMYWNNYRTIYDCGNLIFVLPS